jgi:hypothetical protein
MKALVVALWVPMAVVPMSLRGYHRPTTPSTTHFGASHL